MITVNTDQISKDNKKRYVNLSLDQVCNVALARVEDKYCTKFEASQTPIKRSITKEASESWDDNTDMSTASKYAQVGWRKGQDHFRQFEGQIQHVQSSKTGSRKTQYSMSTGNPSVGRYVSGNPKFYRQRVRQTRPKLDLSLPISANCMWNATEFRNRGLAVIAIAEHYQNLGYDVSISAYMCVQSMASNDTYLTVETPLLQAGTVTDRDLIMFVCAHAAYFRRFGFALIEYFMPNVTHYSYGRTGTGGAVKQALKHAAIPANRHYLSCADDCRNFRTLDQGFETINKEIQALLSNDMRKTA